MKVAIVDDDPIVCSSLSTILLQSGGVEMLWTATDGERAVEEYRSNAPDVLLMDVQMPGGNGLDAARLILKDDAQARVLFLTTFSDRAYIEEALAIGGKGYLIKQDVSSVLPAVRAVMAGQIVLGAQALSQLPLSGNERGLAPASAEPDRFAALSQRERDIAGLIAEGLDNHEIAARLFLSEGTVRNRISDMLSKLGMTNRTQLAIMWIRAQQA